MATYTPNLNLKKPITDENYDIVAVHNDAMDKIDAKIGIVDELMIYKSEQSDLDSLSAAIDTKLGTKVTNGQARVSTSVMPINFTEMDTPTRALFTGGSVAVVGPEMVGIENMKQRVVDPVILDEQTLDLMGFAHSGLTWQIGSPEAGVVKPNLTHSVTSIQLLDISERGAKVYVRQNIGLQWWIAYYDMVGDYTGETLDYITDPNIEPRPNTKIRLTFTFADKRVLGSMAEILNKISVSRVKDTSQATGSALKTIPAHWQSHIASKIATITELQSQGGADSTSLVFITDTHISDNYRNSGVLIEKIVKECDVPFIAHGGDFVTGYGTASKQSILNDIKLDREMFGDVWPRVLRAEGNHDAAYDGDAGASLYYTKNLTEEECYNYMFRHNSLQPQKVVGGNKSYFYQDDIVNKIRIIMLNSSDLPAGVDGTGNSLAKYNKMQRACMRPEQINWFANVALNVPDDTWSVLVCSHIEPYSSDMNVQNGNMAAEILQAFKNKTNYTGTSKVTVETEFKLTATADFTGKGGSVIGWLSGHMHADSINRNRPAEINYNIIETLNDSKNVWSGQPNKIANTTTEQAFDVLTIDKKLKRVNLTRIGAGVNRVFTY